MNTIFSLPQSITAIIIAHRLTTVERCDTLIWIEKGRVQRVGIPEQVLPLYQETLSRRGAPRPS
ncbi:MAG: hypothetical protein LUG19_12820 [Desulfovibrio sp.]|nr:hypothetical protein [Desulfovibrio sp.]